MASQQKLNVKVKSIALDLIVPTAGAVLRFLALQPGRAKEGRGPGILCFQTPLLFAITKFLKVHI